MQVFTARPTPPRKSTPQMARPTARGPAIRQQDRLEPRRADHVLFRELPELRSSPDYHAHAPGDHAGGADHAADQLDDNVNVGLMRYSNDRGSDTTRRAGRHGREADGPDRGQPRGDEDCDRLVERCRLDPTVETFYEATQYYRGGNVYFGGGENATTYPSAFNKSDKFTSTPNGDTPSVTASRNAPTRPCTTRRRTRTARRTTSSS